MRFKRILLLSPWYPGSHYNKGKSQTPPIGLGIIGEMLSLGGVDYKVLDMGLGYHLKDILRCIQEYQPDALGISMMTFRYHHLYSLLDKVKNVSPHIKIIAGGPHITAWKQRVLEQCPAIDFGISHEGELTIQELCNTHDLAAVKGLFYRENNRILFNGERKLIEHLDSIPFPRYERFELDKYVSNIQINSSRGCPYQCIFCQSCSMLGKKWRSRSAEHIIQELQFWYDKGYRHFTFIDDNFTLNKQRIYQLCDAIDRRFQEKLFLEAGGIRVDLVDRALLERMKEAGFHFIAFGIEAGNNRILQTLKKGITIEQADQAVKDATELGFAVKLYFLVGSPYETLNDLRDSIEFAFKYPIQAVNFGSLMPIPETELMNWVQKEGKLLAPPEVYLNDYAEFERVPHFDAPGMSLKERKYALRMTEKVRKKIPRLYRKQQFEKKLKPLGFIGKIGAEIASFEIIIHLLNSKFLKPLKERLKFLYLHDE